MEIIIKIIIGLLFFLAVASGATKIMLVEQEVEFFANYGFNATVLMLFGGVQLLGGNFLLFKKTRVLGASIVAITFLISAVILLMAQNWAAAGITVATVLLLAMVATDQIRKNSEIAS